MAEGGVVREWYPRAVAHPLRTAAAAFLLFRAVDLLVFAGVARSQGLPVARPLLSWDAGWIMSAARNGWPDALPVDAVGNVVQSTLPWPPLPALLARAALRVGGDAAADAALVGVSLLGGTVAAMLLCLTLLPALGAGRAIGASAAWSALPAAPVLAMGYAEGLFTALAFASVWAASERRYLLAGLLLVPAGFTRVTVLPFAAALVVALLVDRHRRRDISVGRVVTVLGLATFASVAWPLWVAVRVQAWDGYARAQSAWGRPGIPFADTLSGLGGLVQAPTLNGYIAFAVMVAYAAAAVTVVRDRRYPLVFRALSLTSPLFLVAAGASVSTARYLVPDPALGAALRSWATRTSTFVAVLVLLAVLRAAWIVVYVAAAPGSPPP